MGRSWPTVRGRGPSQHVILNRRCVNDPKGGFAMNYCAVLLTFCMKYFSVFSERGLWVHCSR